MDKSSLTLVVAALLAVAGASPTTRAARLANGPNFPFGGIGCAIPNSLTPYPPGTQVYLDTTCQSFPSVEWAIGGGGRIIATGLSDGSFACLDIGSTAAGATVVVNPCKPRGTASQRWEIKPAPGSSMTNIVNERSKSCLDTVTLGTDVIGVVINPCSTSSGGQNWQIK